MNVVEKIDQKKSIIVFFLAFVYCAAFVDHLKISVYYLFEVFLFLACIVTGIYMLLSKRIILLKHYVLIPFFLLIVWSLAEMFLFDGLKYAPKYFIYALVEIFIFIIIVINFVDKKNYGEFIKYTCFVFIGLSFILTGYYFSQGVFINFNSFGQSYSKYLLGFGAVCSFYLLLTKRKISYGVLTYLLVVLSLLSMVRKMWLAIFVVYVVLAGMYLIGPARKNLEKKEYRKTFYILVVLLIAILISATLLIMNPTMRMRATQSLGSISLAETSISDQLRKLLNSYALEQIRQSPIIGNGWGDRLYIAELDLKSMYHNCYLSVWSQLGLIGIILYCGVFLYPLTRSIVVMAKKQYYDYGMFILALWLFAAIVLYFRPLNRMSYYLWGPPLIFALIFDAWEAKKHFVLRLGRKKESV